MDLFVIFGSNVWTQEEGWHFVNFRDRFRPDFMLRCVLWCMRARNTHGVISTIIDLPSEFFSRAQFWGRGLILLSVLRPRLAYISNIQFLVRRGLYKTDENTMQLHLSLKRFFLALKGVTHPSPLRLSPICEHSKSGRETCTSKLRLDKLTYVNTAKVAVKHVGTYLKITTW